MAKHRSPHLRTKQSEKPTVAPAVPSENRRAILLGTAFLFASCLVAYWPCLTGEMIWDDDAHMTKESLRSFEGLYRIWFELGATQQYYPLLHSAFWVEHRLWGDWVVGYHLLNVLLHATAACLVWTILRRLKVPGAYLAAAIFALHPVHVESVAWITEQKNTLSAVFYLSAMWCYLHFDQQRDRRWYGAALALFALGLLCKTVTATLPAALLVVFWWQRGSLSWRRDVVPLLPFFALGAAGGLFTAWVERNLIGAEGEDFELSAVARCLLSGRVFWFYLYKLFLPIKLTFIYPRWDVNVAVWWQWLYPLAAIGLFTGMWLVRGRVRGPLAGMLFFAGTLFPVLGFFNVYPFLFSFVADHFQYLASLGVITLVAAGIMLVPIGERPAAQWARNVLCVALLATLGTLTWQQSHMYNDPKTLYQTTIDRNPGCWMAYNNMGLILDNKGKTAKALEQFKIAVELRPQDPYPNRNIGSCLLQLGNAEKAIPFLQEAVRLQPKYMEAYYQLGLAWSALNEWDRAVEAFVQALLLNPDTPAGIQFNLAAALVNMGRLDDAILHFREAVRLNPDFADAHLSLGMALLKHGDAQLAIAPLKRAADLKEDPLDALKHLTTAYDATGQRNEAIATAEKAVDITRSKGQLDLAREIQAWLDAYRAGSVSPPHSPTSP